MTILAFPFAKFNNIYINQSTYIKLLEIFY